MVTVWKEWAGEELNESEWLGLLDRAQRESTEEDAVVRAVDPTATPPVSGLSTPKPPPPASRRINSTPPPRAPRRDVPGTPPRPSTGPIDPFGPWLARQLRRAGLTQSDLATELGLTRAAVSAWITGRAEPRSDTRRYIVKFLEGMAPQDPALAFEEGRTAPAEIRRFGPLERWRSGAAVLIGVSDYTHLPCVPSIKNNLSALTEVALTALGIPPDNVHTVENPTSAAQVHEKIDLAMEAADPLSGGLFIYYAGHGWTDPRNGRLLLGLVDSNQQKAWTAMEFDRIREQVADSPVGSRLLVLDSCYSGAALDTLSAGLSSASRIEGTYVMTSSDATNASRAPRGDQFTSFSGEIIRSLTDGIEGGPPVINADALFRHVRASCLARGWPVPSRQIGRDGDHMELLVNRWGQS
ncbi:hypothetical protein DEJ46_05705 [Streptomyces venezuelae]|uniref:HTH cro/C1-type domain-containing protein n=1 Tax=Streptomyces venezuelae TaxID=54571 RepID=A0A5P2ALZ4_STRVZ|nr:hypothetical protein DEJ46_05705 [Streptomyces venezuelae]